MTHVRIAWIAFIIVALGALPALAHHGWSSYDAGKEMTLDGVIKESGYEHPHGHIRLEVPGKSWVVTLACVRGLLRFQTAFLRTPKEKDGEASWFQALRSAQGWGTEAEKVLVPRAAGARQELISGLQALGAEVDEIVLYRAATPAQAPAEALEMLRHGEIDVVTFTSSSTVRNLAAMLDGDIETLRRPLIACIGPITARTAEELGLRVDVVAAEHTVEGLLGAIEAELAHD